MDVCIKFEVGICFICQVLTVGTSRSSIYNGIRNSHADTCLVFALHYTLHL